MQMPARNTAAAPRPAPTARILPLSAAKRAWPTNSIRSRMGDLLARIVPPLVVLTLMLLVWEFLCRQPGATLPAPSAVIKDTLELILDPFYDRGGIDKGLFWHLSASLQRVALGY